MAEQLIVLVCNLKGGARYETLEGKQYLVVPTISLVEGVHRGNEGMLYYSKEQNAKWVTNWDHKPIVVYHPQLNGKAVSACDPKILESHKVGIMLNSSADANGTLRHESWLDVAKTNKVDARIIPKILKGEMMEVSTGLFVDNDKTPGKWKTEEYLGSVTNYRPDHLAILPDKEGACSIKDGAGLLRNEADQIAPLTINELSHEKRRRAVHNALREKFPYKEGKVTNGQYEVGNNPYVVDTFDSFFIYATYQKNDSSAMFKQTYTMNEDKAVLTGSPVEVKRYSEYQTKDGTYVGNVLNLTLNEEKIDMALDKAGKVAHLLANGWKEADKGFLTNCSEEQLDRMMVPAPAPVLQVLPTPAPALVGNQQTPEQFIANAPPEIQQMLSQGLQEMKAKKKTLVERIVANANNRFHPDFLNLQDVPYLEAMASLAGTVVVQNQTGGVPLPGVQMYLPPNPANIPVSKAPPVLSPPVVNWTNKTPPAPVAAAK